MQGLQAVSEGNYLSAVENSYQAQVCNAVAFAIAILLQFTLFVLLITFIVLFVLFATFR